MLVYIANKSVFKAFLKEAQNRLKIREIFGTKFPIS